MIYLSAAGQELRIHDHVCNQSCHWANVLKPLAYIVFFNPFLIRSLSQSSYGNGKELDTLSDMEYAQWLCGFDKLDFLNLVNVLLHICNLRGVPEQPL
jgi:hypothetical protein